MENKDINKNLKKYINKNIFPRYEKYYSHGMLHINNVINNMLMLAEYYNLNKNMAFTIASYHDIGLNINRERHEFESGKILEEDLKLKEFFSKEQIKIMKEAIEDHRGSKKSRPRSIYGECISDSDRDFNIEILAKRQLYTSIVNYKELNTFDEHFERSYKYICDRINEKGKFNLWTDNPTLKLRRDNFQRDYLDKIKTRKIYKKEWNKIINTELYDKFLNYYEDF